MKDEMQRVYNTVRDHMIKQSARSLLPGSDGTCAYRGADGLMCAVGVLIKDEHYSPNMEGKDAYTVAHALELSGIRASTDMLDMLQSLQYVHDDMDVDTWPNELAYVAEKCGLQP